MAKHIRSYDEWKSPKFNSIWERICYAIRVLIGRPEPVLKIKGLSKAELELVANDLYDEMPEARKKLAEAMLKGRISYATSSRPDVDMNSDLAKRVLGE